MSEGKHPPAPRPPLHPLHFLWNAALLCENQSSEIFKSAHFEACVVFHLCCENLAFEVSKLLKFLSSLFMKLLIAQLPQCGSVRTSRYVIWLFLSLSLSFFTLVWSGCSFEPSGLWQGNLVSEIKAETDTFNLVMFEVWSASQSAQIKDGVQVWR